MVGRAKPLTGLRINGGPRRLNPSACDSEELLAGLVVLDALPNTLLGACGLLSLIFFVCTAGTSPPLSSASAPMVKT